MVDGGPSRTATTTMRLHLITWQLLLYCNTSRTDSFLPPLPRLPLCRYHRCSSSGSGAPLVLVAHHFGRLELRFRLIPPLRTTFLLELLIHHPTFGAIPSN